MNDNYYEPATSQMNSQKQNFTPSPQNIVNYRPYLSGILLWQQITMFFLLIVVLFMGYVRFFQVSKWEYTVLAPADTRLEAELKKAGNAGWEIVFARRAVTDGEANYEMILKRPAR